MNSPRPLTWPLCALLALFALTAVLPTMAANPYDGSPSKSKVAPAPQTATVAPANAGRSQLPAAPIDSESRAGESTGSVPPWLVSVGEWTGRLFAPNARERDPQGGVPMKIENSPLPELIGKVVWVRWNTEKPWDQWFQAMRYDVSFDPKNLEKAREGGLNPPETLAGWKAVSSLESLACARPGDMTVLLKNPEYRPHDRVLLITEEPVQICGRFQGLVRFVEPGAGDSYQVRFFDPRSGDFQTTPVTIGIPRRLFSRSNTPVARSSTVDIEKSPLNEQGWYAYGRFQEGRFQVEALEPRAITMLKADRSVTGRDEVKRYVSREHFDDLEPGLTRITELLPERDHAWSVGDKGLLVHLFGWRKHPDEKGGGAPLGLVTGHFAFGLAEVIACPLTGEPRFDLEYRQAYAHNREGIVAGSMKWHNYSGSLRRGWMYTIPISDTVIRIPELEPYDFDGWVVQPWKGLSRQFEKMHALYRTGAGSGISSVRPDISCVQDSHCALFSALRTFEETIAKTGAVKKWLAGKGADPEDVKRYLRLLALVRRVKHGITAFGLAQDNWRDFFKSPLATRNPTIAASLVNALLSLNSVFPRRGNDHILHIGADMGYPMWSILTCQIGGVIPQLVPQAPTSPTAR
jgi:predicted Abi (CAAX) family protease